MRDRTINQLTELADGSVAGADMVPVYDASASGTRYALLSSLFTYVRTALQSVSAALGVGTSVTTSATAGEVVLPNTKALRGVTAAGTDTAALISLTANNVVQVGDGTIVVLVCYGAAQAANAIRNGGLMVDSANNRLVYYSGGNRYHLTGTSF